MEELRDSSAIRFDTTALRARVREDGYVFVRRAVDPELVERAAATGLRCLQEAGWLEPGPDPSRAPIRMPVRAGTPREAAGDPGYRGFSTAPEFNRIPYDPAFEGLVKQVMGATAFCYPTKVARVVYPAALVPSHKGNYVHRDFGVLAVMDMFTVWTPLMDIPIRLGGLAVKPGSQGGPGQQPHLLSEDEPGWATTDYRAGDLLMFHCLTLHASLPNRSDGFRVSGEFRWQLADDPVPRRRVFGPRGNGGVELYSRLFRREPWWHPVPANLRYVDAPQQPGPSRYVDAREPLPRRYATSFMPH